MTRPASDVAAVFELRLQGHSIRSIARTVGIARATVRDWLSRPRGLVERRHRSDCETACEPIKDVNRLTAPSYAYLLGVYLGDGMLSRQPRDVYKLRIFCASHYPKIIEEIEHAISAIRPGVISRYKPRGVNMVEVSSHWKHWTHVFPQHGPGMKHTRTIRLEGWQEEIVARHPDLFVRALIQTDGCRAINKVQQRKYSYVRYMFSNESTDIIGLFTQALDRLDIEWRMNRPNSVSIARRASVARLEEFVGPKR